MHAISTHQLSKLFRGGQGVQDIELRVPEQSVFAFLGPNGAGKSTTIRLLLGLLQSDKGEIRLLNKPLGRNDRSALAGVGAMVESPSLYPHLSGNDNLRVTATLLGLPITRIEESMRRVHLWDAAARQVGEYSLGMRQRLAIAQALLSRPRLLILDEPGNGLDPAGTADMRALIRHLVEQDGVTVFLSSHLLAEVEHVASHVALLRSGRICFQGRLSELQAQSTPRWWIGVNDLARAMTLLTAQGVVGQPLDSRLQVRLGRNDAAAVNRLLVEAGIEVHELREEAVSLEQLFLRMTNQISASHAEAPNAERVTA